MPSSSAAPQRPAAVPVPQEPEAVAARAVPGGSPDTSAATAPERPTSAALATRTGPSDPPAEAARSASASPLVRGRELTSLLYQDEFDRLWAAFSPSARAQWGDLASFEAYRSAGSETFGAEESLLHEVVVEEAGVTSYRRTVTFAGDPGNEWTLVFRLADGGEVSRFEIVPAGEPTPQ